MMAKAAAGSHGFGHVGSCELVDEGRLMLEVGHFFRHVTGRGQCLAYVRKIYIQRQVSEWSNLKNYLITEA